MTRVKICGIRDVEHALAAADSGADFIGLVFAASKRQVDADRARDLIAILKQGYPAVETVGVFVDTPAIEVNRIVEHCGLDRVQLSGDEPWDYVSDIIVPVIKVIRVQAETSGRTLISLMERRARYLDDNMIFMLDGAAPGSYGGSGQSFDWRIACEAASRYPVMVAGGLTPQNVGEAIRQANPWGVDVSSGVESDGLKDDTLIRMFISAAKAKG